MCVQHSRCSKQAHLPEKLKKRFYGLMQYAWNCCCEIINNAWFSSLLYWNTTQQRIMHFWLEGVTKKPLTIAACLMYLNWKSKGNHLYQTWSMDCITFTLRLYCYFAYEFPTVALIFALTYCQPNWIGFHGMRYRKSRKNSW